VSADYRFADSRRTERFRNVRQLRGLGFDPIGPIGPVARDLTLPSVTTAPQTAIDRLTNAVANQLAPLFAATLTPAQQRAIDMSMWTLDTRWRLDAQWADMRMCIRKVNASMDASGWASSPWPGYDATTGQPGCRNLFGNDIPSACNWGFWRLNKCDIETATTYAFQFPRFLWAQKRMRDLLFRIPVMGVTPPQVAADWCWLAAQLISALQWSTNIRYDLFAGGMPTSDDPNAARLAVAHGLRPSGHYAPLEPLGRAGGFTGGIDARSSVLSPNALRTSLTGGARAPDASMPPYDDVTPLADDVATMWTWWTLNFRSWNIVGQNQAIPYAQNDFSPSFLWKWSLAANLTDTNGLVFDLPFTYTENATLMATMNALAGDTAKGQQAFSKFFLNTWGRRWHYAGQAYSAGVVRNVVVRGADGIVSDYVKLLNFYSQPSYDYASLLNDAMQVYNVLTPVSGSDPASIDFQGAKASLMIQTNQAAAQSAATAADPSGSGGYAQMGFGLLSSLLSMIGGVAGIVGYLLQALMQGAQFLISMLSTSGEATFCPTFPFIRVLSPPTGTCNITTTAIVSSFLGIDTHATWPVNIGGQTRAFVVDAVPFTVLFDASDTTADLVARRINAGAALAGLAYLVASVRSGQVHVEGHDGITPVQATGGTAAALGFPGPTDALPVPVTCPDGSTAPTSAQCPHGVTCPDGSTAPTSAQCPQSAQNVSGGSGGLIFGGLALAALAAWAASRKK